MAQFIFTTYVASVVRVPCRLNSPFGIRQSDVRVLLPEMEFNATLPEEGPVPVFSGLGWGFLMNYLMIVMHAWRT